MTQRELLTEALAELRRLNSGNTVLLDKIAATLSKKSQNTDFNTIKSLFIEWYEGQTELPYYFSAKDGEALKQIINKAAFITKPGHSVQDTIAAILARYHTLPPYYQENKTIPVINSKFNEIINILKNGRKTQTPADRQRQQFNDNYRLVTGSTGWGGHHSR
jgi:hypothetical protein